MSEPTDEQRDFISELMLGSRCWECGAPKGEGHDCEGDRRALLRQAFPQLYGDA